MKSLKVLSNARKLSNKIVRKICRKFLKNTENMLHGKAKNENAKFLPSFRNFTEILFPHSSRIAMRSFLEHDVIFSGL